MNEHLASLRVLEAQAARLPGAPYDDRADEEYNAGEVELKEFFSGPEGGAQ